MRFKDQSVESIYWNRFGHKACCISFTLLVISVIAMFFFDTKISVSSSIILAVFNMGELIFNFVYCYRQIADKSAKKKYLIETGITKAIALLMWLCVLAGLIACLILPSTISVFDR